MPTLPALGALIAASASLTAMSFVTLPRISRPWRCHRAYSRGRRSSARGRTSTARSRGSIGGEAVGDRLDVDVDAEDFLDDDDTAARFPEGSAR
jgi:hypothetical protein